MRSRNTAHLILFALLSFWLGSLSAQPPAATDPKLGHSHLGTAFDQGPRQKPWIIPGIGEAHLPITTHNPEVQFWFDRGVTLLHSFWYYEAERAFRWCNKLEPENAMVYWGLARSAMYSERAHDFLREAVKRKNNVTERERLYIESLAASELPDPYQDRPTDNNRSGRESRAILETLCVRYPDDMEARAFLALDTMGGERYGAEMIIREILAKLPDHPGAHHYRIHNWDYNAPEQALVSARRYGEIVPGIGHALHMPGHIYSIVGMWNEAAISMDAATRAEKQYMKDSLTFPFNNWNYGHNRYYLSYIQEQLGMPTAAIFGSKQLIDAPKDPKENTDEWRSPHSYGIASLSRALVRFEHWDEILDGKTIPWRDGLLLDKMNRAYFEARAWIAKTDLRKAEKSLAAHAALKAEIEKDKQLVEMYTIESLEIKGRLAIANDETIRGLGWLAEAAQKEFDMQRRYADPPFYPESLYNALGEAYLTARSPLLAAQAFEKALDLTKMDYFALSGLVRSYAALGERAKAEDAMAKLLFVTADSEPGIRAIDSAKAAGISATPRDGSPGAQRNYLRTSLEKYGPEKWEPYAAPTLDVRDASGKRVTLEDYRGKNVLLVYYLGQECAHCMEQLHKLGKMKDDWARLDTVLLAVSSQAPDKNAKAIKEMGDLPWRLLSDDHHVNAQRWHSYDDFEEIELHSTILIDKKGRVYWGRFGSDPFSDADFLVKQIERMNSLDL
ncbi:MAG TPA: redoxin domain-containing protein [Bryobacteraceae bacterium]